MLTPPTIMIIAMHRSAITPRLAGLIRNPGKTKPRMILYITTKRGRVLRIVETRDIGPLAIAKNDNTIASSRNISLKTIKAIARFLCFISLSCLIVLGRIEIIKKIAEKQKIARL